MTPERWRKIEALYQAVAERPREERAAVLAETDPELRREVEVLLANQSTESPLDRPAWEGMGESEETIPASDWEGRFRSLLTQFSTLEMNLFQPGDLLEDRFRIIRELAKGGMGVVYEALDEKLDRRIALKCARAGFGNRLPPEARTASEISHPNVCKVHEIHTAVTPSGSVDFVTMEFVDGETLTERLKRAPMHFEEAIAIARQVCAGLAEAHRKGIVHGDLKCNNILLAQNEAGAIRSVITDFGLSRNPGSSLRAAKEGSAGGTPAYMAPELRRGEKLSIASDIYALGVVLFELAGGSISELVECSPAGVVFRRAVLDRRERQKNRWGPFDSRWNAVLAGCLAEDPALRYADGAAVAHVLAPSERRKWQLAAAAGVMLLAGVGAFSYWNSGPAPETVRLAAQPFDANAEDAPLAESLFRNAMSEVARLKNSSRTRLSILGNARSGASHLFHGSLERRDGKTIVHAFVSRADTGVNLGDWKAEYQQSEWQYAPVALSGFLSETLDLPPPPAAVKDAAKADYQQGLADMVADRHDAELQELERAAAADPDSALVRAALAEARYSKYAARSEEAWWVLFEETVREAEVRNPDVARVHRVTGWRAFLHRDNQTAIHHYLRALTLDPNDSVTLRRLSDAYLAVNQSAAAFDAMRKAVAIDPGNYKPHEGLGTLLFNQAEYAAAIVEYQRAIDLAPQRFDSQWKLAKAMTSDGRFSESEGRLRGMPANLANLEASQTAKIYGSLGSTLLYQRKYDQAAEMFQQAEQRDPEAYIYSMNRATADWLGGRKAKAHKEYQLSLHLADVQKAKGVRLSNPAFLAFVCARLGDQTRAEAEAREALRTAPNDPDVQFAAAITFEALGERKAALELLAQARKGVLEDLNRWPDLKALQADPAFIILLHSR